MSRLPHNLPGFGRRGFATGSRLPAVFGQMWKTCQAFPERYQSVVSDPERLPPQYVRRILAGFTSRLGILNNRGLETKKPLTRAAFLFLEG
jgi:hypothetical protein